MRSYDERRYLDILRSVWGYDNFRGIQSEIIRSIADGNDTLGLMPTGGGKSLTFQVPALAMDGVCVVVTPLIALMKDQVENLRRREVLASAIYSGMSRQEILKTLDNCILGNTKILYVSPERIASDMFQAKLAHINVSFITVDEAHCISQWGYDFRPSYLRIADIRRIKPDAPVLALTATATARVIDDIQEQLAFKEKNVFRMSFERKNLAYVVRHTSDKQEQILHILKSMQGSAIVYVRNRKKTRDVSQFLNDNDISATFYHAGLEHSVKDERQTAWHDDKIRVMVATNAFGMGIDKPNVRLVIHMESPDSLEAYFQEAGRAGRDGEKAYAVLLYDGNDTYRMEKRLALEFPAKEDIVKIYEHLAYYFQIAAGSGYGHTFLFEIDKFSYLFHHFPTVVNSALKILARSGYIAYDMDPDSRTRLKFTIERDQLYMLKETTPNEELVITSLLREYSGLFNDYRYIDEGLIATMTKLTREQVYLILKSLSQRRIIHFIPERSTPLVTYTRERVLPEDVVITKEAYEDRRKQMASNIKSMVSYASNDEVCRSRQLLRHFGETTSEDCGMCDVCVSHKGETKEDKDAFRQAIDEIKKILSDGNRHEILKIKRINIKSHAVQEALAYLVNEEIVEYALKGIIMRKQGSNKK